MRNSEPNLQLHRVGVESAAAVQAIIDAGPKFALATEGTLPAPDSARAELTALPPGCTMEQKFFFLIRDGNRDVGIIDLIQDYPRKGTAFLGLLQIREDLHARGYGAASYRLAEAYARETLGAKIIRLAYVANNPVAAFWLKMGFRATGEQKSHVGKALASTAILMQKEL